jgi:small nuclear ribonucleoprotein (snRNP)-like protein
MLNSREKAILSNSLVVILRSCLEKDLTIDLRNESSITGICSSVTVDMNVTLSNAIMTNLNGKKVIYKEITIRGNNIRFVQIPDSVDMISSIQNQINSVKRVRKYKDKNKSKKL